mmetsp:Transcript_6821/g.10997  ORF Transcript_6821/g.10997 Transcript_6821/m.10997 type:complete len:199 (+) Transcript_6821:7430-8026(+)
MNHLEERSHDYIKITPERLNFFRDFSTLIAIAVSFVVIGNYKYDRIEKPDGSSDYTSSIDVWPNRIISYLGYAQLVTSISLLVGFCLNKINIIIKSNWRAKTHQGKVDLKNEIKYILDPLTPKYGELKASDLPLEAGRILLHTEGPFHKAFYDQNGKKNYGFLALEFEQKWIGLSFLMQDGGFIFILIYMAFSFQGLF